MVRSIPPFWRSRLGRDLIRNKVPAISLLRRIGQRGRSGVCYHTGEGSEEDCTIRKAEEEELQGEFDGEDDLLKVKQKEENISCCWKMKSAKEKSAYLNGKNTQKQNSRS